MTEIQARVIHAMTIPFTVQIAVTSQSGTHPDAVLDPVMPDLERFLAHVDHVFSPFRENSSVCRARRGDWSALLNDPDFAEVYALCQQAQQYTDGTFNPMHAGVYDPTGLVKGWAIQRAHERFLLPLIRSSQCEAAAFGGGGDIQAAVSSGSDFAWRIGVQDPFDRHATLRTVTLRNGAIATSGTMQRGEHITRSNHTLVQATVVADHLVFADVWATAAINVGESRLRGLIEPINRSGTDDITAILVDRNRNITCIPDASETSS